MSRPTPPSRPVLSRRHFLLAAGVAAAGGIRTRDAAAAIDPQQPRSLAFEHLHTGEALSITYFQGGRYVDEALTRVNVLLRDFRNDAVHPIEPGLLDILFALQRRTARVEPFHVISAYRSPTTNRMLRSRSSGVAEHSLHMDGRAIDIRLPGLQTNRLALLARSLQFGGVGYYRVSDFVHVDTGRVRLWGDRVES